MARAPLADRLRHILEAVARIEAQWSYEEVATHFAMSTPDAARMAVARALRRLMDSVKKRDGD